jgi:hypothetical protein
MTHHPASTPTATTGTLTRNTDPHQKCASSRPPTTGPMASPAAPNTAQAAMARPRASGGYRTATIASAGAITAAAPIPITARAPISVPVDELNAASRQLNPNSANPPRKMRRRPYRSARPPPSTRSPASTMLYASTTHWSPATDECSDRPMNGSATLVMVMSTAVVSAHKQRTAIATVRRRGSTVTGSSAW